METEVLPCAHGRMRCKGYRGGACEGKATDRSIDALEINGGDGGDGCYGVAFV